MKIDYHRNFKKEFRKLNAKQQAQFAKRLALFIESPNHPLLRVHELAGVYKGNFSFSLTGDLRVHFIYLSAESVLLTRVGTHAQLYE